MGALNFIDLSRQKSKHSIGLNLGSKIERNIKKVLKHGQYIMGPEVKELN